MLSRRLASRSPQFRSPIIVKRSTNTSSSNAPKEAGKSFAERNPFVFQLGVATSKTAAADMLVQVVVEKKKMNELDLKRNGIFVLFGFAYLGGFQYWLMVTKFSKW